jgi:Tfp pilus assembly protein PilF
MAASYHELGIVAWQRGDVDGAEDWYRQSLTIEEQLGNRPGMADSYHQLGIVAWQRGDFDGAEDWYRQSLTIEEQLGNRPSMARTYHELGRVAQARGELDRAEDWYRHALTIEEQLGDRPAMAMTYGQLGLLAEARQQLAIALEQTVRCVALFDQFPHPATGPGPYHLARLTAQLGMGALEETWTKLTGQPLPATVRAYVARARNDE